MVLRSTFTQVLSDAYAVLFLRLCIHIKKISLFCFFLDHSNDYFWIKKWIKICFVGGNTDNTISPTNCCHLV